MIISKKLQVVTQKEILDEVVRELKLNKVDVRRTYSIWLDFLNHISNETSQSTIYLPNLGKIYVSFHKIRTGLHTERLRKFKEMKSKELEKLDLNCKYNIHKKCVPIILKYGISKKNSIPYLTGEKDKTKFYTVNDIVNNQTSIFFKEDIEFSKDKKLEKYFKRLNEKDIEKNQDDNYS